MVAGIAISVVMTVSTPATAQTHDGDASTVGGDVAAVDGLRVARTGGTLAVLNWRPPAGVDSHRIVIGDRTFTSENGWLTVRFLRPLQTYTASVSAVADGQTGPSEQISFTTSDVTLRDPRIEVDTGVYRLTSGQVPFAWDTAPFTTIELFRDGVRLDPTTLGDVTSRLLDSDVIPGETYVYQARLVSEASGAAGPFGPEITVTIPADRPVVTAPYADNSVAVLRIEGLEQNIIEIERDGVHLGAFPRSSFGPVSWFGDRELQPFAPRTYRVRQVDRFGVAGKWSDPVTTVFTGVQLAS